MAVTAAPTLFSFVVLLRAGRANNVDIVRLVLAAPPNVDFDGTVFRYLDDTLVDSVGHVIGRAPVFSLLIGVTLCSMLWILVRPMVDYSTAAFRWILPTRGTRVAWTTGFVAGAVLLFALGFDWMRWISTIALAATIAASVLVIVIGWVCPRELRPPGSDAWYRPVPAWTSTSVPVVPVVIATYLVAFPPLPVAVHGLGETIRQLVFVNAPG